MNSRRLDALAQALATRSTGLEPNRLQQGNARIGMSLDGQFARQQWRARQVGYGRNRSRRGALRLTAQRSNKRQGILTGGAISPSHDRRRGDLRVRGRVPNIAPARIQLRPGALRTSRDLHRSGISIQAQLQIWCARAVRNSFGSELRGFQVARDRLPQAITRTSCLDCAVCHFCYSQAIESTIGI